MKIKSSFVGLLAIIAFSFVAFLACDKEEIVLNDKATVAQSNQRAMLYLDAVLQFNGEALEAEIIRDGAIVSDTVVLSGDYIRGFQPTDITPTREIQTILDTSKKSHNVFFIEATETLIVGSVERGFIFFKR